MRVAVFIQVGQCPHACPVPALYLPRQMHWATQGVTPKMQRILNFSAIEVYESQGLVTSAISQALISLKR